MAVKEKLEHVSEEIEWNVETEVQLFYAMHGHKPVGVNKYFQMACIIEKFRNSINKNVSSRAIWSHLDTMYDMQALDDTENLPFPNEEKDFSLPVPEYEALMEEKTKSVQALETNQDGDKKAPVLNKNVKEVGDKHEMNNKDSVNRKDSKDTSKENKKDIKEPRKTINKETKETRRESRDSKEIKKEFKRDGRETPKEIKKELPDPKVFKPRSGIKEKREYKKDDSEDVSLAVLSAAKKDRARELSEARIDDSPKRAGKRSTRGSMKPDDAGSNKSSSPVTTATPPPMKRRRT